MVEYSKDELTWPEWVDSKFFTKVIRSYKHDESLELKSFNITPGSAPGEHFASVMYRITVVFASKKYRTDSEEIKLIMKLMPYQEGFKKEVLKDSPLFKNEIRMYASVLPEMERILEQCGGKVQLAPP